MSKDIEKKMRKALKKFDKSTLEYVEIGGLSINVGLPSDRIHNPSGLSLAELGAIHEFGIGDMPERSFLRSSVVENKDKIERILKSFSKKAANGEDADILMEKFAIFGQSMVQEKIVSLKEPALQKPRKDGSDNPLVDSGALKQGVIGVVVSD